MNRTLFQFSLIAVLTSLFHFAQAKDKETIELPVTADLGLGVGELHSHSQLTASDKKVWLFKPELSASISGETLTKYKDKLPDNVPDWLTKADISYSPYALPTIYFTESDDSDESVYGFSIGPGLDVAIGGDYLTLGGGIGLDLTYLYMESDRFDDNHYVTLGANASWKLTLKPIRYFHLEIGQRFMQHIEKETSNGQYLGRFREDYAMLHFRFPFTTQVKL